MPTEKRDMPRTQTSAPVKPPETTEDPRDRPEDEGWPTRQAGDESGDHGDRMPRGADEPGAGL